MSVSQIIHAINDKVIRNLIQQACVLLASGKIREVTTQRLSERARLATELLCFTLGITESNTYYVHVLGIQEILGRSLTYKVAVAMATPGSRADDVEKTVMDDDDHFIVVTASNAETLYKEAWDSK